MRRLALLALASLLGNVSAKCTGTLIHFGGEGSAAQEPRDISASTARMVIAQRLGRTEDLVLEDVESLKGLDEFRSGSFIGQGKAFMDASTAVVRVMGLDGVVNDITGASYCVSEREGHIPLDGLFDRLVSSLDSTSPSDRVYMISDYQNESEQARKGFTNTLGSSRQTIYLITPPNTTTAPSRPSLRKRDIPTETPLSSPSEEFPDSTTFPDFTITVDDDDKPKKPKVNPHAYKRCYHSVEACEKSTASCSGHGKCVSAFVKGIMASPTADKCFVCACEPSVGEKGEGPTHWAGLACQKRDVSVPFNIFLGLGIILFVLMFSAVGLLYSMGSEELPAVLGAGVGQKKTN